MPLLSLVISWNLKRIGEQNRKAGQGGDAENLQDGINLKNWLVLFVVIVSNILRRLFV